MAPFVRCGASASDFINHLQDAFRAEAELCQSNARELTALNHQWRTRAEAMYNSMLEHNNTTPTYPFTIKNQN
jgi:hypothetical protein